MGHDGIANRRTFLLASAAASLRTGNSAAPRSSNKPFLDLALLDSVNVETESGWLALQKTGLDRQGGDLNVETPLSEQTPDRELNIKLSAPTGNVLRIHLCWQVSVPDSQPFPGDQRERAYGDLGWRSMDPDRILRWYWLAFDGRSTSACGVKTVLQPFIPGNWIQLGSRSG